MASFSTNRDRNVMSNKVSISSANFSTLYSANSSVDASKYVPGCVNPRSSRHICRINGFSYRSHTSSCSHWPIFPWPGRCRCLSSVEYVSPSSNIPTTCAST